MVRPLVALLLAASLGFGAAASGHDSGGAIAAAGLPPEAQRTLALIRQGGPFPYAQDGTVFGNRERMLPRRGRGWYREYTVPTPGARDRGARRIVAGGEPRAPRELYYTDDHYRSFKRIDEQGAKP